MMYKCEVHQELVYHVLTSLFYHALKYTFIDIQLKYNYLNTEKYTRFIELRRVIIKNASLTMQLHNGTLH